MDLASAKRIECLEVPARWTLFSGVDVAEAKREIVRFAGIINRGTEAISGLYMRMVDMIRHYGLTDAEVNELLREHFPGPRISEILRVSRASDEVYNRYRTGFFGFKAALQECRGYAVTPSQELKRKKVRRAAERLIVLGAQGVIKVRGKTVTIS